MWKAILTFGVLAVLGGFSAKATDAPVGGQGNYVSAADIQAVMGKVNLKKNSDTILRMIDVGNAHVGVALIHRPKAAKGQAGDAMQHSALVEIYYVVSGHMVMVTGGKLVDAKPVLADAMERNSLASSMRGNTIDPAGAETKTVGPGDIVFVPINTPHLISEILDDVTILIYRIDATNQATLHDTAVPRFIP